MTLGTPAVFGWVGKWRLASLQDMSTTKQAATTVPVAHQSSTARSALAAAGVTALRVVVGVVFLLHGWQKLSGGSVGGTQEAFAGMGIPLASLAASFTIGAEVLGGFLLILGLLTRVAAAALGVVSAGAVVFVHGAAGFFAAAGGYEYVLVLAAVALFFALAGPGAWSADRVIVGYKPGYRPLA